MGFQDVTRAQRIEINNLWNRAQKAGLKEATFSQILKYQEDWENRIRQAEQSKARSEQEAAETTRQTAKAEIRDKDVDATPDHGLKTRLVNLTPHAVTLVGADGTTATIPSSGPARVSMVPDKRIGSVQVDGVEVPLMRTSMGTNITGLPSPQEGTIYIVSRQVVDAYPERTDLFMSHQAVRNGEVIVGCRALARPVFP